MFHRTLRTSFTPSLTTGLCALWMLCLTAPAAPTDYREAIRKLGAAITEELRADNLTGISIALVDDQRLVAAEGYGFADRDGNILASSNTVYRAGSISKLFTAMATLQWVESGRLNLDAPVTDYLPELGVINPFDDSEGFTLRQLMCHRSGMVRESPVGSYFDSSEPTVAATVQSLSGCVLIHPPGARTKYSNSGVTVVGHVVSKMAQRPFQEYQQDRLLLPLGMRDSGFVLNREWRRRLAQGYMHVADGQGGFKEIKAPLFQLGTLPAGNLYTTTPDLARFLSCLFARGRVGKDALVQPESLTEMWTPQLMTNQTGFGLGFFIGTHQGRKTFRHTGAVYGFSASLTGLPEEKIGVVLLANDDLAIGPVRRLNELALDLMLEAKLGVAPPEPRPSFELSTVELGGFSGTYESDGFYATLQPRRGGLAANVSFQLFNLRPVGPLEFLGSGRLANNSAFHFQKDADGRVSGFTALGRTFQRIQQEPAASPYWKHLRGAYGPDFIPVIISVRHGHLYASIENEFDYRLKPVTQNIYKMPPGMYSDEYLEFVLDHRGRVEALVLANMVLKKFR